MGRTTITTFAGLMTLGVVSACSQTTSDTAPAEAADSTAPATSAASTAAPATDTTATTDSTMDTGSTAPATGQTGMAPQQTAPAGNPVPATQADITAGATVNDSAGVMIGTVESVDATGVVLKAGSQSVKLPINSFGKAATGLMIGTTKADFDAKVAASTAAQPTPAPSTPPQ
jgi:hypothetical protein